MSQQTGAQSPALIGRAVVFANGDCDAALLSYYAPRKCDLVVCVDGGLTHCIAAGWSPNLVVGDMDSIDSADLLALDVADVEQVQFPSEKDASDLELALELLSQRQLSEVIVVGVSGGRTDHMLFNWWLPALREWPFQLQMHDRHTRAYVVQEKTPLDLSLNQGAILSLLALTDPVGGVTAQGLLYGLDDADLLPGSTCGLSNVCIADRIMISVRSGTLLVLVNRPETHSVLT